MENCSRKFIDLELEDRYLDYMGKMDPPAFINEAATMLLYAAGLLASMSEVGVMTPLISIILMGIAILLPRHMKYSKVLIMLTMIATSLTYMSVLVFRKDEYMINYSMIIIMLKILFMDTTHDIVTPGLYFHALMLISLLSGVFGMVMTSRSGTPTVVIASYLFNCTVTVYFVSRYMISSNRKLFLAVMNSEKEMIRLQREVSKTNIILDLLMPPDILNEYITKGSSGTGEGGISHLHADSRVSFICFDNTNMSDLVSIVNKIGMLCRRESCEKIKIDDGKILIFSESDSIYSLVRRLMRLPILTSSRAGIARGPVMAGIIGNTSPRYDIWGDTVNRASRLMSNASIGEILSDSPFPLGSLGISKRQINIKGYSDKINVHAMRIVDMLEESMSIAPGRLETLIKSDSVDSDLLGDISYHDVDFKQPMLVFMRRVWDLTRKRAMIVLTAVALTTPVGYVLGYLSDGTIPNTLNISALGISLVSSFILLFIKGDGHIQAISTYVLVFIPMFLTFLSAIFSEYAATYPTAAYVSTFTQMMTVLNLPPIITYIPQVILMLIMIPPAISRGPIVISYLALMTIANPVTVLLYERSSKSNIIGRRIKDDIINIGREKEINASLLDGVMPRKIVNIMIKSQKMMWSKSFDSVTVFCSDIVGFTSMCSILSPSEVIGMLNELFGIMDKSAARLGLRRLKLVGDAYICVAGIEDNIEDHRKTIIEFAEEVLTFVRECNGPKIRVGISTGRATAMALISDDVMFNVSGEAIEMATKLESEAPVNGMKISMEGVVSKLESEGSDIEGRS